MLSLVIADKSFAVRERALLSRLEVGLADEGVRVIHAAPAAAVGANAPTAGLQSTIVPYDVPTIPLLARPSRQAHELIRTIQEADGAATAIDIVHAFGERCWPLAAAAADACGAGLLLEVYRPSLISAAVDLHAASRRGAISEFLTSEPSIAGALSKQAPRARVYSSPWGVHVPGVLRSASPVDRPVSIAVLFDAAESKSVAACLGGIVAAGPRIAECMVEIGISDRSATRESRVWSAARRAGLLDRASILPDMESRREPVLEMDLLLVPEAGGWERTLVLEAMGMGMGVIAAADAHLDILKDETTAVVVAQNTAGAWAAAIRGLIENPAALGALRASAHTHIRSHRTASSHIEAVLRAYRAAVRPVAVS